MKYLITGGAGFIGSHLTERLVNLKEEVYVLDDLSTGSLDNLGKVRQAPNLHFIQGSVTNEAVVRELVSGVDAVFHLAAAVGVRLIVERPVHTIITNIHGTETVLASAEKKGKKVLITSTSEIYGKNDDVPFSEEADMVLGATTKSRWSYACSKAIDEFLALSYFRQSNLPVIIARLFNTVGPRQTGQYGMVLPRFVQQALTGKPITVYNDGSQTRSFSYVGDVVEALIRLVKKPEAVGEVFNIGSDEEISIRELAQKVRELVNPEAEITFIPYAEAYERGFEDMRRRVPDIRKIKEIIGYKPTRKIDEIILEVADYLRKRLGSRQAPGGGQDL